MKILIAVILIILIPKAHALENNNNINFQNLDSCEIHDYYISLVTDSLINVNINQAWYYLSMSTNYFNSESNAFDTLYYNSIYMDLSILSGNTNIKSQLKINESIYNRKGLKGQYLIQFINDKFIEFYLHLNNREYDKAKEVIYVLENFGQFRDPLSHLQINLCYLTYYYELENIEMTKVHSQRVASCLTPELNKETKIDILFILANAACLIQNKPQYDYYLSQIMVLSNNAPNTYHIMSLKVRESEYFIKDTSLTLSRFYKIIFWTYENSKLYYLMGALEEAIVFCKKNNLHYHQREFTRLLEKINGSSTNQKYKLSKKQFSPKHHLNSSKNESFNYTNLIVVGLTFILLFIFFLLKKRKVKINNETKTTKLSDSEKKIFEKFDSLINDYRNLENPHLSLGKISRILNTNTSTLSKVVNIKYNMTFPQLINKLRIELFCELIISKENEHLSIEAVSNKSGFNSKSTFNKQFKIYKNTTPKQYIQLYRK